MTSIFVVYVRGDIVVPGFVITPDDERRERGKETRRKRNEEMVDGCGLGSLKLFRFSSLASHR